MRNHRVNSVRRGLMAVAACLLAAGCSRTNAPTDVPAAKAALTAALETWKSGQAAATLQERSPAILMVDQAWRKGEKLESFETTGEDVNDGVNLHCPVKLVLCDKQGVRRNETVTYVVGTSPSITIFRDLNQLNQRN
jgi:hypothetical protein